MTVTLNLPPRVERAYLAEAEARGLPLADVIRDALVADQTSAEPADLSTEEWLHQFSEWTASHADITVVLPNESHGEESIYADRGL